MKLYIIAARYKDDDRPIGSREIFFTSMWPKSDHFAFVRLRRATICTDPDKEMRRYLDAVSDLNKSEYAEHYSKYHFFPIRLGSSKFPLTWKEFIKLKEFFNVELHDFREFKKLVDRTQEKIRILKKQENSLNNTLVQ